MRHASLAESFNNHARKPRLESTMSKRAQRNQRHEESPTSQPRRTAPWWITPVVVAAVLAVFSYLQGRQIKDLRAVVGSRLDQVDTRLVQLSTKIDDVGKQAAAAAPRRGPDPNRVYTIKTDGSPVKGPVTAPVTIAEFSDFQ